MTVGRPPALADKVWEAAAKSLGPEKSLERVETHAKYLFSTVTIFGTLLTGFGLFAGGTKVGVDPRALFWPIALVCSSLSLSMFAMTPSSGRVNINDLADVQSYFTRRLLIRGAAILLAGLLFAAAILVVIPVVAKTNPAEHPTTSVTLKRARTKESDDLSVAIRIQTLPANVTVDINAVSVGPAGTTTIFRQRSTRRDGGEIAAEFSIPATGNTRQMRVTVLGTVGAAKVVEDVISLDV